MNCKDYLWYPYLKYQKECREQGKEDSIQEFLILRGKVNGGKPKRARNGKGQFVANNPNTSKNEAWVGGVSPSKSKSKKKSKKYMSQNW